MCGASPARNGINQMPVGRLSMAKLPARRYVFPLTPRNSENCGRRERKLSPGIERRQAGGQLDEYARPSMSGP